MRTTLLFSSLVAIALALAVWGCDSGGPTAAPEQLQRLQQRGVSSPPGDANHQRHPLSLRGTMSGRFVPGSSSERCPADLPLNLVISGEGQATVLGNFELSGDHCTRFDFAAPDQLPVPFRAGRITFDTDDGDLVATYEGLQLQDPRIRNPFRVKVDMAVDPDASTGRFAGATGRIHHVGTAGANTGEFSVKFRGIVSLAME